MFSRLAGSVSFTAASTWSASAGTDQLLRQATVRALDVSELSRLRAKVSAFGVGIEVVGGPLDEQHLVLARAVAGPDLFFFGGEDGNADARPGPWWPGWTGRLLVQGGVLKASKVIWKPLG